MTTPFKYLALVCTSLLPITAYADTAAEAFIRQQQRQEQLQKQLQPDTSVRLDESVVKDKTPLVLIQDETVLVKLRRTLLSENFHTIY